MIKTVNNIIVLTLLVSACFAQNIAIHEKIAKESLSSALLSVQESYPVCGTTRLIPKEQEIIDYFNEHPEEITPHSLAKPAWNFEVGEPRNWYAASWVTNDNYLVASTCRAVGENCYIFVADDNWNASIENGPVDQAAVDAIVEGFDNNTPNFATQGIFGVDITTFGEPPNIDGDPKIIILDHLLPLFRLNVSI